PTAAPLLTAETTNGCSEEEDLEVQEPQPPRCELDPQAGAAQHLPALQRREAAARRLRELRLVRRPPGDRRRLTPAGSRGARWSPGRDHPNGTVTDVQGCPRTP